MTKKLLVLSLVLFASIGLSACGGSSGSTTTTTTTTGAAGVSGSGN